MAAKDPAFLFYPKDFISGTQFMSNEQVGKYIRLLLAQHQMGRLQEKHMMMICGTYDEDIFSKFKRDEDGKYYNERIEIEIDKRKKFSESRSKNRKSLKNISLSSEKEVVNVNANVNTDSIPKEKESPREKTFDQNLPKQKLDEFSKMESWLDAVSMQLRTGSREKTQEILLEFLTEQNNSDKLVGRLEDDLKHHFIRWARIELSKKAKPSAMKHSNDPSKYKDDD